MSCLWKTGARSQEDGALPGTACCLWARYRGPAAAGAWPARPPASLVWSSASSRPQHVSVTGSGDCWPDPISSSHSPSRSASSAWLATHVRRWDRTPRLTRGPSPSLQRLLSLEVLLSLMEPPSAAGQCRPLTLSTPPRPARGFISHGAQSSFCAHLVPDRNHQHAPTPGTSGCCAQSPEGSQGAGSLGRGLLGLSERTHPPHLLDVFCPVRVHASTLPGRLHAESTCAWAPLPQAPGHDQLHLSPPLLLVPAMLWSPLPYSQPRPVPDPSAGASKASHPHAQRHTGHARGGENGGYLMSSSVTMKALQRGCAVFSHTPGFFSTAAESCPVMGMVLVCRALAMADSRVSSVQPGPTPAGEQEARSPPRTGLCPSALAFVPATLSQVGDRVHDSEGAPRAAHGTGARLRPGPSGPQDMCPRSPAPTAPPAALCSEGPSGGPKHRQGAPSTRPGAGVTLQALGEVHGLHELLSDVKGIQTTQLLLPEELSPARQTDVRLTASDPEQMGRSEPPA